MKRPTLMQSYRAWKHWSESPGDDMTVLQLMALNRRLAHLRPKDRNIALGFIVGYSASKAPRGKKRGKSQ